MGTRADAIQEWHESHRKAVEKAEKKDKGVADLMRKNPLLNETRAREILHRPEK